MQTQTYSCQQCGATFQSKEELDEHNRSHHGMGGGMGGNYTCAACGATFSSQEELQEHARKEHQRA